jgi:hypothetical protein
MISDLLEQLIASLLASSTYLSQTWKWSVRSVSHVRGIFIKVMNTNSEARMCTWKLSMPSILIQMVMKREIVPMGSEYY